MPADQVRRGKDYSALVRQVTDILNNLSFSESEFCREMANEHRTLQQSFTRLCLTWLETCASEDYRTDGRNEQSHEIAKKMFEALGNEFPYLPMI